VLRKDPWKIKPNGFYLKENGDLHLMVEKVGGRFRVVVSRIMSDRHPEEIVYAGSAASADDAMTIAERAAAHASTRQVA
jgi:hypothetical protein